MNRPMLFTCSLGLWLCSTNLSALPQWSEAQLSDPRAWISTCVAGSKGFFAGGNRPVGDPWDTVDIYDVQMDSWSVEQLVHARTNGAAVSVGGEVLVGGGTGLNGHLDAVDHYDLTSGVWTTSNLSLHRAALVAGSVADLAIFAGGYNELGRTDRVDIYSSSTSTWSTASLSVPRSHLVTWTFGNRIFFAGGNDFGVMYDTIDIYDAATGSWSTATLPQPMALMSVATLGNKAYMTTFGLAPGEVWIYDDSNASWSSIFLSDARTLPAVAVADDRIIFAGGWTAIDPDVASDVVDIWDSTTNTWQTTALFQPAGGLSAISLPGMAVFAGGEWAPWAVTNLVQVYAPGPGHGYCFGDGTGQACPCTNDGAAGHGCANSSSASALLTSFGSASVAQADLGFSLEGGAFGQPALLFAGLSAVNGGAGNSFGDGLRCAGNSIVRLSTHFLNGEGETIWDPSPTGGWTAGNVRYFQAFYRDPAGPCSTMFNTSNGVEVQFVP